MMDPIIAIMAIIGIGGGFAGLWWGWREGEREAHTKRLSFALANLTHSMNQFTFSTEELRRSFEAASRAVLALGVSMASLKPREPWRDRFHSTDDPPPWTRGRERIGEHNHRKLLAYGIDDGMGDLFDPSRSSQKGGAGRLAGDLPAEAVQVDPPGDMPGPGTAPPETEK